MMYPGLTKRFAAYDALTVAGQNIMFLPEDSDSHISGCLVPAGSHPLLGTCQTPASSVGSASARPAAH